MSLIVDADKSSSVKGSTVVHAQAIPIITAKSGLRMIQPGHPELMPYCEEHGHAEKVFGYIGNKRGIGILCTYCDALYTRKPTSQEQDALNRLMDL